MAWRNRSGIRIERPERVVGREADPVAALLAGSVVAGGAVGGVSWVVGGAVVFCGGCKVPRSGSAASCCGSL